MWSTGKNQPVKGSDPAHDELAKWKNDTEDINSEQ